MVWNYIKNYLLENKRNILFYTYFFSIKKLNEVYGAITMNLNIQM